MAVGRVSPYNLLEITLSNGVRSMDLIPTFVQATIYEDIGLPVITGQLIVSDTTGIVELFPLVGNETVTIRYSTSLKEEHPVFERTFFVHKISEWSFVGHRKVGFNLHLVTMPMFFNLNKRIRRSYADSTSKIVENICKNMLGINDVNIESTFESRKVVIPNLRPFEAISKMANISIKPNSDDEVADFVFFENHYGHNFASLQTLANDKAVQRLNYKDAPTTNKSFDPDRVNEFKFNKLYSQLENIQNGMYANTQLFYDATHKEISKFTTKYTENFKSGKHVEPGGVKIGGTLSNNIQPDAHVTFMPLKPDYVYDTRRYSVGARLSQMQAFSNYELECECEGNNKQTIGKVVFFDLNSIRNSDVVKLDEDLSGRYLIFRMKRQLTSMSCKHVLNIRKDSLRK